MIVVDTSAIVAIFRDEPERDVFIGKILQEMPAVSAASVLECSIVMRSERRLSDARAEAWLDALLKDMRFTIHDITADHVRVARVAHSTYGKGTGHGAGLNFGDCFSYALAKALDLPLLYKGNDFAKTDIVSALT